MSKREGYMSEVELVKGEAPTCVQCGEYMPYGTNWDKFVPVCTNPRCPCWGLLQIGIEKMEEIMGYDKPSRHKREKEKRKKKKKVKVKK
jgi:hypothetical protein